MHIFKGPVRGMGDNRFPRKINCFLQKVAQCVVSGNALNHLVISGLQVLLWALYCTLLHHIILYCAVSYHIVKYQGVFYCIVLCYTILYFTKNARVVIYCTIQTKNVPYHGVLYCIALYHNVNATWYCAVLYINVLY